MPRCVRAGEERRPLREDDINSTYSLQFQELKQIEKAIGTTVYHGLSTIAAEQALPLPGYANRTLLGVLLQATCPVPPVINPLLAAYFRTGRISRESHTF
jgi:hypothetical protein